MSVGHAALREAAIPKEFPVDARLVALSESAEEHVAILVGCEGLRQELPNSEKRVRICIDAEGMDETQRYIKKRSADRLAGV